MQRRIGLVDVTTQKSKPKPKQSTTPAVTTTSQIVETTTKYTHIQKISKKKEKVVVVYPVNSTNFTSDNATSTTQKPDNGDARNSKDESLDHAASQIVERVETVRAPPKFLAPTTEAADPTAIYIDLPVFDTTKQEGVKYIPVSTVTAKGTSR